MATLKRGKFWQISGPCKCKGGTVLKCVLTGREYHVYVLYVHVYTLMYMYCMYGMCILSCIYTVCTCVYSHVYVLYVRYVHNSPPVVSKW